MLADANGKRLNAQGSFASREKAASTASAINAAWSQAKGERKAKGAAAITEAAKVWYWNDRLHPRDRLGRFTDVLLQLKKERIGSSVRLPGGEYVTFKFGRYRVHASGGAVTGKTRHAEKAAQMVATAVADRKHSRGGPTMAKGYPTGRYDFTPLKEPKALVPLARRQAWGLD